MVAVICVATILLGHPMEFAPCSNHYVLCGVDHYLPNMDFQQKHDRFPVDDNDDEICTNATNQIPPPRMREIVAEDLLVSIRKLLAACDVAGVRIWASGSTLLGAVRHEGFVPWCPMANFAILQEDLPSLVAMRDLLEYGGTHILSVSEDGKYLYQPRYTIRRPNIVISIYGELEGVGGLRLLAPCTPFDELHRPTFEHASASPRKVFSMHDVFPLKMLAFEGSPIPVPRSYRTILKQLYGPTYLRKVGRVPVLFSPFGEIRQWDQLGQTSLMRLLSSSSFRK